MNIQTQGNRVTAMLLFYILQINNYLHLNKSFIFFEDLLPKKIPGPYIKCRLQLRSSHVRHVVIDDRKLKSTKVE